MIDTPGLNETTWPAATLLGALLLGYAIHRIFWWMLGRFARRTSTTLDDSLVRHCRRPTVLIFPIVFVYVVLPALRETLAPGWLGVVSNLLKVLLPVSIGWTLVALWNVAGDLLVERYDVSRADNLRARAVHTQFRIVRRIASVAVGLVTLAVVLMSFEDLRQLGTGLLASAGLAGLVIGLAAQRTLSNLLAGVQIALTQPIRLDDVLIVEGEWGRVEEITLTYVVVCIWDLRRLVVPISYFLERPFENWTRVSSDILGTVSLHVDHSVPVQRIRERLTAIVEGHPDWDGKVCGVQVTNTSPQGIEVRALVSAADAGKAWNLRCDVREKLVDFLRERYPGSLPRLRAELYGDVGRAATPA